MSLKEQRALKAAVEVIKAWHGRQGWETYYQEAAEMLPIREAIKGEKPAVKVEKPSDPRFKLFRDWYVEEYARRNKGEKYPFQGGRDGQAIKVLLATYDLEGAKKKAVDAWTFIGTNLRETEFIRRNANSIAALSNIAGRVVDTSARSLTEPGKWDAVKGTKLS